MKVAGARGITRSRIPLIAVMALAAIGMAGCSGEDGQAGPVGPTGPGGGVGPTGPTGSTEVPIEQGGPAKIGDGTTVTLTAEQIEQIGGLVATIDSVSINATPSPVVEFTVKTVHGGPALGLPPTVTYFMVAKLVADTVTTDGVFPSRWQSYVNRVGSLHKDSNGIVDSPGVLPNGAIQANTEQAAAARWVELGDGKYRYTYGVDLDNVTTPLAVAYEPSLTHRVGLEIRMSGAAEELAPDNPVKDLVPNGGAGSGDKLIAATENCEACHFRFDLHGGPRRNVEYCVTCHNPATVDPDTGEEVGMAYMAHSIHTGEGRANEYKVWGFTGEFDFSEVTYPQSTLFCENCHTASPQSAPDGDAWKLNPSASACGGCHNAGLGKTGPDATTGRYTYTYVHTSSPVAGTVFDDGTCAGCHRDEGVAGDILEVHQKPVFATTGQRSPRFAVERGRDFTYEILNVTNAAAGQTPTVTFRVLDKGQPIDVKSLTAANGTLTLDFAWNTKDFHTLADKTTGTLAGNRGRAMQFNLITEMASVVAVGDGSYTYTLANPMPTGVDGDVMVALEGRRQFADTSRAAPESAIFFPGGPTTARKLLVSQEKCEKCHELLTVHGNNRTGNPLMCTVCHNSSGGWKSDEGGAFGGPIALGAFVHNIHKGKVPEVGAVTFPQSISNCEACHNPGDYNTARVDALPISVDAGPDQDPNADGIQNQNLFDDTWSSATAGTCGTCHDSGSAMVHMEQNGGVFEAAGPKALVPSSATESCAVCHGPGRTIDTVKAHAE